MSSLSSIYLLAYSTNTVRFWDVKQFVLPIPVGGSTRSGKLIKEYILYQLELENSIPKVSNHMSWKKKNPIYPRELGHLQD